jgi:hypothetical protein
MLLNHVSPARLAPYRAHTADLPGAIDLYQWNVVLSGAFQEERGLVEVFLRNAIDRQLRAWNAEQPPAFGTTYTADWIENPARPLWSVLNPRQRSTGQRASAFRTALARARKARDERGDSHPRHGAAVTHDDLVAQITFGTWNALLPRRLPGGSMGPPAQRVIWDNALKNAFAYHPEPQVIKYWVDRLHRQRNRVAHGEPLIDVDVLSNHRSAIRLLRAIEPSLGDWFAGNTRVPQVYRQRPT